MPVAQEAVAPVFPEPLLPPVLVEMPLGTERKKEEEPALPEPLPVLPLKLIPPLVPLVPQQKEQEHDLPPRRQTAPFKERGIFGEAAGARGHLLDIHTDIPMGRRHGWRRWMDIGIVSVFTGLLLATVAALVDVTAAMDERPRSRAVTLKVLSEPAASAATAVDDDPFAGVEV